MGNIIPFDRPKVGDGIRGHAPAKDFFAVGGFLPVVHAAHITFPPRARAIETIRPIRLKSPSGIAEHGRLLERFAHEHRLGDHGSAALHSRAIGIDRWAQASGPFGERDISGFCAASGSAPRVETEARRGVKPAEFA